MANITLAEVLAKNLASLSVVFENGQLVCKGNGQCPFCSGCEKVGGCNQSRIENCLKYLKSNRSHLKKKYHI